MSSSRKSWQRSTSGANCSPRTRFTFSSDNRLPPLLGEPFGGGSGLVDVGIGRHPRELAVLPYPDDPAPQLKREVGVMTPVADLDGVYDPVAQIHDVLYYDPELVKGSDPLRVKPTNSVWTRVGA